MTHTSDSQLVASPEYSTNVLLVAGESVAPDQEGATLVASS